MSQSPWEPDPSRTGNWRSMFEQAPESRRAAEPPPAPFAAEEPTDDAPGFDPRDYRPWILQRGRTRPTMMLHLRRFEARSGLWMGWALSYPCLTAVEYTGDRLLSLDFGARQFVVEGVGLHELIGPLQQGTVLAIQEYSRTVWAAPSGAAVHAIRQAGAAGAGIS